MATLDSEEGDCKRPAPGPSDAASLHRESMQQVSFNVDGETFSTRRKTFYQEGANYFTALIDAHFENPKDSNNVIFIDRCKERFRHIMWYLRGYYDDLLRLPERDKIALIEEAKFYGIEGVIELIRPTIPPEVREEYVQSLLSVNRMVQSMAPWPASDIYRQHLSDAKLQELIDLYLDTLPGRALLVPRQSNSDTKTSAEFSRKIEALLLKVLSSAVTAVLPLPALAPAPVLAAMHAAAPAPMPAVPAMPPIGANRWMRVTMCSMRAVKVGLQRVRSWGTTLRLMWSLA